MEHPEHGYGAYLQRHGDCVGVVRRVHHQDDLLHYRFRTVHGHLPMIHGGVLSVPSIDLHRANCRLGETVKQKAIIKVQDLHPQEDKLTEGLPRPSWGDPTSV